MSLSSISSTSVFRSSRYHRSAGLPPIKSFMNAQTWPANPVCLADYCMRVVKLQFDPHAKSKIVGTLRLLRHHPQAASGNP